MTSGFFDRRETEDRVRNGRYQLDDPETGQKASWQRASNFGYPLSDHFGLNRWERRQLLKGLAARPDLLQALSAMHASGEVDNGKLDEWIKTALEVAGTTAEANRGTAIHDVLTAADRGLEVPDWGKPYVESYRAELSRHGLTVVFRERLVLNRALGVAGRTDAIYRTADGRYVIGDVKTTGHLDLQQHEIAVQVAVYSGAEWIEGDDGELHRLDAPIDDAEAVVVHVDREHATAAVYRLVLPLARHGANLAAQVHAWRKTPGLLLPYVRPLTDSPPVQTEQPSEHVQMLTSFSNAVDASNGRHLQAVPNADHEACTSAEDASATAEAVKRAALLDQLPRDASGAMVGTPPAYEPQVPEPNLKTEAELMKLSKAAMQQYGRERGVTDLAHNKPQLLPIFKAAGIVASPDGVAHEGTIVNTTRPVSPQELPVAGPPAPTEDPTDPKTVAFRQLALGRIRSAKTVGELGSYHQSVVRQYGDQAWTDELTEAARVRVEQIDATGDAQETSVPAVIDMVRRCMSQQGLADLWDRVTMGGSVPDRWPDEVQRAAKERLDQIRAATPPPPSNPFTG